MIKVLIILFAFLPVDSYSQVTGKKKQQYYKAKIVNKDTILLINTIYIFPEKTFKSESEKRKYIRLIRDLKKVYPYSVLARNKFVDMQQQLYNCKTESQKKKFSKDYENALLKEYGDEMKKLTITQGRLLLKLIDREIGITGYVLLKEYRSTFSAVFWQTLARMFGTNLKDEYDPEGEDILIEEIVSKIEAKKL